MRKVLGDKTTTNDIAKYIEDKNLDYVKLKAINDGDFGDVSIVNHKKGNYLKSLMYNNGMFDMTNPNIYKSIIGVIGTGAALNQKKQGGATNDYIELELTDEEIQAYKDSSYIVEEMIKLNKFIR